MLTKCDILAGTRWIIGLKIIRIHAIIVILLSKNINSMHFEYNPFPVYFYKQHIIGIIHYIHKHYIMGTILYIHEGTLSHINSTFFFFYMLAKPTTIRCAVHCCLFKTLPSANLKYFSRCKQIVFDTSLIWTCWINESPIWILQQSNVHIIFVSFIKWYSRRHGFDD